MRKQQIHTLCQILLHSRLVFEFYRSLDSQNCQCAIIGDFKSNFILYSNHKPNEASFCLEPNKVLY